MAVDRLDRVIRAARHEATVATEQRPEQVLVRPEQCDQQRRHAPRFACSSSERTASLTCILISFRGTPARRDRSRNNMSRGGSSCCACLNASRMTRFSVLRPTALGRFFRPTTTPSRGRVWPSSAVLREASSRQPITFRRPLSNSMNAAASDRRAAFGNRLDCGVRGESMNGETTESGGTSDAEADTALGATCGQDLAAADGLHPCAEAMRARTLDDGWLVCTFHFGSRWCLARKALY